MTTPASLQTWRATMGFVAQICDELVPEHAPLAPAVAHYFRHGTPGHVPQPLDELALTVFKAALQRNLQQKRRGLRALLDAGLLDLLVDGEAFEVGDGPVELVPHDPDAVPPPPVIPTAGGARPRRRVAAARHPHGAVGQHETVPWQRLQER